MKVKQATMVALRWSRRCLRAVRSLSPLAAFGLTAAIVLGGAGVASAANGGNFILGHSNTETLKSTLSNSNGTPLQLNASAGNPPLKVNSSVQVPSLNASEVGGLSASKLVAGGDGFTATAHGHPHQFLVYQSRQHRGPGRRHLLRDRDRAAGRGHGRQRRVTATSPRVRRPDGS